MRKLLILLAILLIPSLAFAASPAYPVFATTNGMIESPVGADMTRPITIIKLVRYASGQATDAGLTSGDVVIWDWNSQDGVTISACTTDNTVSYAGVLVTPILTSDIGGVFDKNSRNWGYMATHGYCLAKVDTTYSTSGRRLVTNGGTLGKSFATIDLTTSSAANATISYDIGILLTDTGTSGVMPVMLK